MANFYQKGRKKFNILIDDNQKPIGGKWSFDQDNRKKIPSKTPIPEMPKFKTSQYHESICSLINEHFSEHPGLLRNPWFPVTRRDAEDQFSDFIKNRMGNFGIMRMQCLRVKTSYFIAALAPH